MNFGLFIVCNYFCLLCSLLPFIVVHYARDCSCADVHTANVHLYTRYM